MNETRLQWVDPQNESTRVGQHGAGMAIVWAEKALLEDGWAEDVKVIASVAGAVLGNNPIDLVICAVVGDTFGACFRAASNK